MEGQPPITVYSKPSCVQCTATYRALRRHNLDFKPIDLTSPDNLGDVEWVRGLGYQQVPVVAVHWGGDDTEHWSGFRPDAIEGIAEEIAKRLQQAGQVAGELASAATVEVTHVDDVGEAGSIPA